MYEFRVNSKNADKLKIKLDSFKKTLVKTTKEMELSGIRIIMKYATNRMQKDNGVIKTTRKGREYYFFENKKEDLRVLTGVLKETLASVTGVYDPQDLAAGGATLPHKFSKLKTTTKNGQVHTSVEIFVWSNKYNRFRSRDYYATRHNSGRFKFIKKALAATKKEVHAMYISEIKKMKKL